MKEWNGTIPFYCHGTVPFLCSVWIKNCHGTVPFLCPFFELGEDGMEWSENGIITKLD